MDKNRVTLMWGGNVHPWAIHYLGDLLWHLVKVGQLRAMCTIVALDRWMSSGRRTCTAKTCDARCDRWWLVTADDITLFVFVSAKKPGTGPCWYLRQTHGQTDRCESNLAGQLKLENSANTACKFCTDWINRIFFLIRNEWGKTMERSFDEE